jgi:hypothetical protein
MPCFRARHAAGAAMVLALCGGSRAALAEPTLSPDELPPPGEYTPLPGKSDEPDVRIHLSPRQPGLSYRVIPEREQSEGSPDRCEGSCTLYLAPGDYTFEVFDHGRRVGTQMVSVKYDANWWVKPQNRALEWFGLGSFVVGSAAAGAGVFLMGQGVMDSMCEDSSCATHQNDFAIGFGLGIAGAVLMPVGWHLFWPNRQPIVGVHKVDKTGWTHRVRVGAAPTDGGARFALGWTF